MMRFWCSILSIVLLAGRVAVADPTDEVTPAPDSGDKIQFRLKLQAGQAYLLQVTTDSKMTQVMRVSATTGKNKTPAPAAQKIEINTTNGMGMEYRVTDVDAAGITSLKLTYRSMFVKIQTRMGAGKFTKSEYDSARPPVVLPAEFKPMAALVGQSISVKLGPDGRVRSMQGLDALMTKMLNQYTPAERKMMEQMFKSVFSEDTMKEMIQRSMAPFPNYPIGIGDSWQQKTSLTKGFPLTLSNTMTLKERRDGIALVDMHSTITARPTAAGMSMGATRMSYNLAGQQQGTMEIEEATGMIVRADMTQRFAGPMTVDKTANTPGVSLQLYSKTDITMAAKALTSR